MSDDQKDKTSSDVFHVMLENLRQDVRMLKILVFSIYGALALAAFKVLENIIVKGTL